MRLVRLEQHRGEPDGADLAVVEELVGGRHGRDGGRREARREVEVEVELEAAAAKVVAGAAGWARRRAEEARGVRVVVAGEWVAGGAGGRADERSRAGAVPVTA